MRTTKEDALIAVQAKSQVERELAQLSLCPPSRHLAFAAIMAVLVVSPAIPIPLRFTAIALALFLIVMIVQWDKRRLGMFINGYRRGKTRMVVIPLLAIVLAIYSASVYFAEYRGQPRVDMVLAAVAFVVAYAGSTLWQRVFRRELGA